MKIRQVKIAIRWKLKDPKKKKAKMYKAKHGLTNKAKISFGLSFGDRVNRKEKRGEEEKKRREEEEEEEEEEEKKEE